MWFSTDGEIVEFRPSRVAWRGVNSFSIIGTDSRTRLRQATIRFKTAEDAREAAAILEGGIVERASEAVPEGTPVEVRYYFPRAIWIILFLLFLPYLLAGIFLSTSLWSPTSVVVFLIVALVVRGGLRLWVIPLMGTRLGWLGGFSRTGAVRGRIEVEGNHLKIVTLNHDPRTLFPSKIVWESPNSFTIETYSEKIELSFSSPEEAATVITMIRGSFPSVKEEHPVVS